MTVELIATLDRLAARAAPAAVTHDIGGWLARWTPGMTAKRLNSVWAHSDDGAALESKLTAVERFYGERGTQARYQLSPACAPTHLTTVLRRRGYVEDHPTLVQRADLDAVVLSPPGAGVAVDLASSPPPGWWDALAVPEPRRAVVSEVFARIEDPLGFATVTVEGAVAASGMGVLREGWLGVFNMATRPPWRRRGAARAALGALVTWARSHGAGTAYLQVDAGNAPALGLYAAAGFQTEYAYAYLTEPAAPGVDLRA